MNGNIINYKGKVNLKDDENIGYLIEHQNFMIIKTGLYNLRLFAQVLGQGFDKAYSDKIIDAFGMRPYIKKKLKIFNGYETKISDCRIINEQTKISYFG